MFCVYYTEEIRNVRCACRREPISAHRLRDVPSSSAIKRPRLISKFFYIHFICILYFYVTPRVAFREHSFFFAIPNSAEN